MLINRLKKKLQDERRMHRTMRTMLAQEIESKNVLEKVLRLCVDDVKSEILKKQNENKMLQYSRGGQGKRAKQEQQGGDQQAMTEQERERIVEVLMS